MKTSLVSWHKLNQQLSGYYTACSQDGSVMVTATREGVLRVFVRGQDGVFELKNEYDYKEKINALVCGGDASVIVTASDNAMRIMSWNGTTLTHQFEYAGPIRSVSCSNDGNLVVICVGAQHKGVKTSNTNYRCGYAFKRIQGVWQQVWAYTFKQYGDNLESVVCSGDGMRIITGSWGHTEGDKVLRIFEYDSAAWHHKSTTTDVGYNTFWSLTTNYDGTLIIAGQVIDLTADVFAYDGTAITQIAALKLASVRAAVVHNDSDTVELVSTAVACNHDASVIIVGGGSAGRLGFYVRTKGSTWRKQAMVKLPSHVDVIACSQDASIVTVGVGGATRSVYVYEAD